MKARTIIPLFTLTLLVLLALPFAVAAQEGLTEYSPEATTAYRWTAMGRFYADHGMLTDDPDAVMATRWLAMGQYYEDNDLLNWQAADYEEAADCQVFRWLALAEYYADHDLLTREPEGG